LTTDKDCDIIIYRRRKINIGEYVMAKNRLKLDFSLEYVWERNKFVTDYLDSEIFKTKPPTSEELETISNYILWGKEEDGKSAV
jgi:hypothetical protein